MGDRSPIAGGGGWNDTMPGGELQPDHQVAMSKK